MSPRLDLEGERVAMVEAHDRRARRRRVPAARRRGGRDVEPSARSWRRRGPGNLEPGAQPVRRHRDGLPRAFGRASARGPSRRLDARRVTGPRPASSAGALQFPTGALPTPISKRGSTRTTTGSSSAPASTNAASRPGRHHRDIGHRGRRATRSSAPGSSPPTSTCSSSRPSPPNSRSPTPARIVGETLGLHCGSFDMNAACAGFVYELVVGASMLQMGYDHVLLVGAETLEPHHRSRRPHHHRDLFGDGAGRPCSRATDETPGLLAWDLGCDGSAAELLEIPAGGSRLPRARQTVADRGHYLKMPGPRSVPPGGARRRRVGNVTLDARRRRRPTTSTGSCPTRRTCASSRPRPSAWAFEPDRTLVNIDRYGNTSSASIPLALFEAVDDGRVRPATSCSARPRRRPDVGAAR